MRKPISFFFFPNPFIFLPLSHESYLTHFYFSQLLLNELTMPMLFCFISIFCIIFIFNNVLLLKTKPKLFFKQCA